MPRTLNGSAIFTIRAALIIGDRKTPHGAVADLAANLRMRGFDARYVDLEAQDHFLDRFPKLKPLIPFNSDNRRNIGYLMAKERAPRSLSPSTMTISSVRTTGTRAIAGSVPR